MMLRLIERNIPYVNCQVERSVKELVCCVEVRHPYIFTKRG